MTDARIERVGHNEALYRQVNERIEELNDTFSPIAGDFAIVCECGKLECAEQLRVTREVYEQTRAQSTLFILVPGHQMEDVERVVEDHGHFVVVEKTPPEARRVARDTDPRA